MDTKTAKADLAPKMAEPEIPYIRPPEPITITVHRARNLRGQKGDVVNVMIRVEFGDKVLGDTPKLDCTPEAPAEFNHNSTLNCTYDDPLALDEIGHKPVVLTVTEVLPKEKRQKEEKTNTLGQCTVDLLPLVKGETKHKYTLTIQPSPGSPLEQIPAEGPKPEVDITVSVNEPLLDCNQLKEGNLLTITMESLFSPPESWVMSGQQYFYAAALPVPISCEKENVVVFANGLLKPGAEKEVPNKQKKWASPGSAQGGAMYIPDSYIAEDRVEDEDGDFKTKEDREHRALAEQEKNRVGWNTERRCYLETASVRSLQESIARNRLWPVEIMRLPQGAAGAKAAPGKKGKSGKDDEGAISFHGVAFIDFAPLLYPGVKRIRGAYKVIAYTDQVLHEKTKRRGGISEEAARIAVNIINRNSSSPSPKKGAGKEKESDKKDAKKNLQLAQLKSDAGSEADTQAPVNTEGQQFNEARSYIMLEVCLSQPLVPKRPPEELARRVAEYIPPRPLFPKRTDGAQRAVDDYHYQIASVANLVLDEFRELFGDELKEKNNTSDAMEARRQKLLYTLNSSGKYFAFKEQLKHSVVKIVREKYLKTTNFTDRQELQTFLSELYVYLVDQMHVSLGKVLALEDQPPIPEPLTDAAQLKHFAREAEVNENYDLAAKYYQERIARDKSNADHWLDYGVFNLYINDVTKAEECFKECVSINQKHIHGLLLYGVVATMTEKNDVAETFFEAATCVDPKSILSWTMLGLFYDAVGNEIGAEMAYLEASKLNQNRAVYAARAAREEDEDREKKERRDLGEDPEGQALSDGGLSIPGLEVNKATPALSEKATPSSARSNVSNKRMSISGSKKGSASMSGAPTSARKDGGSRPGSQLKGSHLGTPCPDELDDLPPREPTPVPSSSIFMHAIEWLLQVHGVPFAERALAHELLHPSGGPTAQYQIALAKLHLQKREFEQAEECLQNALQFEYQNGDAWALLGHVKYLTGSLDVARDCYERTISFVNQASEMHPIYLRLASIYLQEHKYQDAKEKFLLACKHSPSCVSWLGVGIACYRLDELLEAEDALSEANILNNADPEVWGYLSLVCLKTGRQLEAEQAYKYAIKLQLQDADLLEEIHSLQQRVGFGDPQF